MDAAGPHRGMSPQSNSEADDAGQDSLTVRDSARDRAQRSSSRRRFSACTPFIRSNSRCIALGENLLRDLMGPAPAFQFPQRPEERLAKSRGSIRDGAAFDHPKQESICFKFTQLLIQHFAADRADGASQQPIAIQSVGNIVKDQYLPSPAHQRHRRREWTTGDKIIFVAFIGRTRLSQSCLQPFAGRRLQNCKHFARSEISQWSDRTQRLRPDNRESLMTPTLQNLNDQFEIAAIRPRFGRAADRRDWAAMTVLFTDHVDVDMTAFGVPAGQMARTDVVGLFQHAFRNPDIRTQQLYGSIDVVVNGDVATCISYLHGRHAAPGFPDGDLFQIYAEYTDQLVRTDQGWRISGMALKVISISGNPALVS